MEMSNEEDIERLKADLQKEVETHKAKLESELRSADARFSGGLEHWKELAARDRIAWQHELSFRLASFRAVIDFALSGIKTLVVVHGGAIVVMLAFVGSVWDQNERRGQDIATALMGPMVWFSVGLALALVTSLCAYFSQSVFTSYPYPEDSGEPESSNTVEVGQDNRDEVRSGAAREHRQPLFKVSHHWGRVLRIVSLLTATGSIAAFLMGAWIAFDRLGSLKGG